MLNAAGAPGGGLGNDGDYYINTTTGDIHLKTTGSWNIIVAHGVKSSGDTMTGPLQFSGTGQYGLRLNNLTSSQISGLTPANGAVVYNSTIDRAEVYLVGSGWTVLGVSGTAYPTEVASVAVGPVTGTSGAVTAYAVAATAMYRVGIYVGIHVTAGDTLAVIIGWTDDDSHAQTYVVPTLTLTPNTNYISVSIPMRAKTGTNITYSYTQTGSSAQFYLYVIVERLA